MTDASNGFDEKAAREEAFEQDRRDFNGVVYAREEETAFVEGARYQYEKDRARIAELEELVREALPTVIWHHKGPYGESPKENMDQWLERAKAAIGEEA